MASASRFSKMTIQKQDAVTGILLVLPSLVVILGITLQPVLSTLYMSFFETPLSRPSGGVFIGFGNYISILKDSIFWATISRTIYFTVVSVGLELVFGIAIAQLIHSHPPGWKFLRTSLILPWAIPTVVNGAMWRWIYSADYGALNALLLKLGLIDKYVPWLTYPDWTMNLVILADVWHSLPFIALIIQAALAGIPLDLDEAAAVDGASALQRFFFIRLPLLRSAVLIALVIRTVEAFRVFDLIYVITRGGPAFGTVTISFLTYFETFTYGHVGKGSALSFLISMFTLGMALLYIRMLYKPEESRR